MRELWSTMNTYTVYKNGEVVGWIKFIRWESRPGWFIDSVSSGLPVSMADFDASSAKSKLDKHGYTYEPGESKPMYLYK